MNDIEILADDIKFYKNITSPVKCSALCKGEDECFVWTYYSGMCHMKSNRVFTAKNPPVTSGRRECNNSGNDCYWTRSYLFVAFLL